MLNCSIIQRILILITLFTGFLAAENKTYTDISTVRQLSHAEAEKNHTVELQGIITYSFKDINIGFIHDGTAGIFYMLADDQPKPAIGDKVIITAKTGPGEFAPILIDGKISTIGKGKLPEVSGNSIDDIFNGHEDSQWIGVRGLIKSIKYDKQLKSILLKLDMSGRVVDVYIIHDENQELPFNLLGSTVYIEGVCGANFNQKRQLLGIRLFVQNMDLLKILKPEQADPFTKKPLLINQILQYSTTYDRNQRIRVKGTVIYQGAHKFYVEDSTGSIVVYSDQDYNFKIGDIVDIVGFAEAGEFSPEIKNALCKKTSQGETLQPARIDSLTSLIDISEASLINLDANLVKIVHQKSNSILYLEKDSIQLQAIFETVEFSPDLDKYELGSIINITGIAHLESNLTNQQKTESGIIIPQSLIVILRKPTDIILIDPPPWFTIEKAVGLLAGLTILIMLSFGWVYLLKRKVNQRTLELKKSNQDLISSQKEKDAILQNVEEGLFLLDDKLIIQSQFSAALLDIMQTKSPANKSFTDFLTPYLKEETINTIIDFIDLIFVKDIDMGLIKDLNPVNQLAFHFRNDEAESYNKYLSFDFKQVTYKNKEKGLIVTVIDETEEFKLAEKLKKSEEKSKKQLEWLKSIINLDPKILNEFLSTSSAEIEEIEKRLKELALEQVSRSLHLLKGNATLLDLKFFAQHVHTLEDIAVAVKLNKNHEENDYSSLVKGVHDLKNDLKDLNTLINKLALFSSQTAKKTTRSDKTILNFIDKMTQTLAKDLGKKIHFDSANFKFEVMPAQYLLVIKNVLIQLTRNSLSHGIEAPDERKKKNKPETGQIQISSMINNNNFVLKFRDDGRGLQLEKLKEKALANGNWDQKEINTWDRKTLADIIFESGISSANDSTIISGRGVGMDLIKNQLAKYNGKIEVNFAEDQFCEFTVTLPLINEN